MTREHPAFFGESPEDDRMSGIPQDLVAYLEAADEPEEQDFALTADAAGSEEEAEVERAAALRALVEHSLLLGPDPSVLADIDSDELDDDEEEHSGVVHEAALDEAAERVAVDNELSGIYDEILTRNPEHKIAPTLQRVHDVLDILGDPHSSYPSIHITGTNGKTSTARMIDSLLSAFGVRVGRFTSPHLTDPRERVCLEGEAISPRGFIAAYRDVEPYIRMVDEKSEETGGPRLSFFEVLTVMAYAAFADYPVDAAVVEVGMGGTWDATNTIDADVSVILPIAMDHDRWLGHSIREIAEEKAGVIKPKQVVVIAKQSDEALEVLERKAREMDAIVRLEGRDFEVMDRHVGVGGQMVTIRTPSGVYEDVFVPLFGEYQASNAAAALVAAEALMGGRVLDGRLVEQGLMAATSPGRLQVVRTSPTIIVDSAHNPAAAATLGAAIEESFGFRHTVGVYSAMADKDIEGVLSEVEPVMEHIVLTTMPGERAAHIDMLREVAEDVFGPDRVDVREELADALDRAVELAESTDGPMNNGGVVVFGSVVLAGAVTEIVKITNSAGNP